MSELKKGGYYRHYKNKPYRVVDVVRHSESLEELVMYEALYENKLGQLWVRPKEMFLEKIEIGGQLVDRFAFVGMTKPSDF